MTPHDVSHRGMLVRLEDGAARTGGRRGRRLPRAQAADVLDRVPDARERDRAEDIVQEAFLRFHKETTGGTEVDSAKAYLSAVTTRLSIDHLRSARVRRERYVGTWLPEPILTEEEDDVALHAETADSLSMGFLVLLESLTPVERAVFLDRKSTRLNSSH